MSTGAECQYIEVKPDKWMALLEFQQGPTWDWREDASAYGFFPTQEEAWEWLRNNFANPGGFTTMPYENGRWIDAVIRSKAAECEQAKQDVDRSRFPNPFYRGLKWS